MYYLVRNAIIMYPIKDLNRYKQIFYFLPKMFFKIILLNVRQKKIFLRGYFDGVFNISGKRIIP